MSIRKRTWKTPAGETRESWQVSYTDGTGKRRARQFDRHKEAKDFHAQVRVDIRAGRHTPDSVSITVREAGANWIKASEAAGLGRTSIDQYIYLVEHHVGPLLGNVKLSKLTAPMVAQFRDRLRTEGRSPYMVKRAVSGLSMILAEAHESGHVAQNVARSVTGRRKKRSKAEQRRKLRVGVDIPTPAEVKLILASLTGRARAFVVTALFTGLRGSELRALRWDDVDLNRGELHVRQRADQYNDMDKPKSEAGERTVPLLPELVTMLKEWKLACPKGKHGLVFPNGRGNVESHKNLDIRIWMPAQVAAGVVSVVKDDAGRTVARKAKYSGLHAMRHFFASWCINRKVDGGLELPAKVVQERLGHASITMTLDTYGHLFPRGDDGAELAAAGKAFFG